MRPKRLAQVTACIFSVVCATAFALSLGLVLFACGSPAPPSTPVEIGAKSADPAPQPSPPTPGAPARPANVALWIHAESLPTWFRFFGFDENGKPASGEASHALDDVAFVDFTRSFDFAVSMHDTDDFEIAGAFSIKDSVKALEAISKSMDVTERKSRYILTPKKTPPPATDDSAAQGAGSSSSSTAKPAASAAQSSPPDSSDTSAKSKLTNKTYVCEFVSGVAICGTERGFSEMGPWLRARPKPQKGDLAIQVFGEPLRPVAKRELLKESDPPASDATADAETQRKQAEAAKKKLADTADFIRDFDNFDLTASLDDSTLDFSTTTRMLGVESATMKPLFAKTDSALRPDLLWKLTENASAALFSQGSGGLTDLLDSFDPFTDLPAPERQKAMALLEEGKKIFRSPYGFSYGVDTRRVSKALADFKAAKDPEKAKKALAAAVDGYALVALSVDVKTAERITREALRIGEVSDRVAAAKPGASPAAKADHDVVTVRVAPAALSLPKGSFFIDTTSTIAGKTPKAPKKKEKKTTALVFGDTASTFMVAGLSDDKTYADTAKEVLARKGSPREIDPLLQQKGLLYGGQVTSLIGAFTSHEFSFTGTEKMDQAAKDKIVADLEQDLASPNLPIPFAIVAARDPSGGPGGALSFEIKGDKRAFSTIFEHAFKGLGALFLLPLVLPLAMAFASP